MNHLAQRSKKLFVDSLKLKIRGGTGGHGLPQFGGIGGKGGDVYIKGSRQPTTLSHLVNSPLNKSGWFKAEDGHSAIRTRLLGKPGKDLCLKVPLGVTVGDSDGQLIGEINSSKDEIIVAMGGRGGDKFNDNHGFLGQKRIIKLDLKMISDAVFVGFPNAGKSSLLRAISNARPKVANYPFTTLRPYLGVVEFQDYRRIVFADLPGLVEGAHKNIGLGHEFLKHIVRSKVLVFVIDVNDADLGPNYAMRSPIETLCILNKEIELYDDTLLNKPSILVVSKMDSMKTGYAEKFNRLKDVLQSADENPTTLTSLVDEAMRPTKMIKFDEILPVSSVKGTGLNDLKQTVRNVIDKYEEMAKLERDKFSTYEELQPSENNRLIAN